MKKVEITSYIGRGTPQFRCAATKPSSTQSDSTRREKSVELKKWQIFLSKFSYNIYMGSCVSFISNKKPDGDANGNGKKIEKKKQVLENPEGGSSIACSDEELLNMLREKRMKSKLRLFSEPKSEGSNRKEEDYRE